jgi:formylmethanofuran dehydrogenase subunit D
MFLSRYDGVDSMDFFVPFAGWTNATIKQTAGSTGLCGLDQVDLDYIK